MGKENVDVVLEHYAEAYSKTGLNEAEIWGEIVCDSLGDMKIFAGDKVISEFMAPVLKDIKQAVSETKGEANKTRGAPEGKASRDVIELSKDNDLSALVEGIYGAEKYKKIAHYIQDILGDQEIVLSVGRIAVVDKSDAMHIANKSATKKTAQISKIKEIVQAAKLYAEDKNVDHPKFNEFYYYKAQVKFDAEEFPIYLNVGRAKNNGVNHIYDITNKIRDTADRINGLERPKPNEGYALTNGISSKTSIPQNSDLSTPSAEKVSEGKASRELDTIDYSQVISARTELNKVREDIKSIEKSDDFKAIMDKISDSADEGINAYLEWKQTSGYGDLFAKRDKLEAEVNQLSKAYEDNRVNSAKNAEQEAIKKSGLSEADYFRKEAEKEFGYTPYYYDAGYILPNGKMLNFSGEKGKHFGTRGEDHRAIGIRHKTTERQVCCLY